VCTRVVTFWVLRLPYLVHRSSVVFPSICIMCCGETCLTFCCFRPKFWPHWVGDYIRGDNTDLNTDLQENPHVLITYKFSPLPIQNLHHQIALKQASPLLGKFFILRFSYDQGKDKNLRKGLGNHLSNVR